MISKDTHEAIRDILFSGPMSQRELKHSLGHRSDFGPTMLTMFAEGEIIMSGTGERGNPVMISIAGAPKAKSEVCPTCGGSGTIKTIIPEG